MSEGKLTLKDYIKAMGPGAIMSAAIIGPGTVTTASQQGALYGFTSLWILLVACVIAYFFSGTGNAYLYWMQRIGNGWSS